MKVIAIILFVMQALSLFGTFSGGGSLPMNIPYLLGYFLPTIIGIILLSKSNKKKQSKETWLCPVCKTFNPGTDNFCSNCGTRKP